MITPSTVAGDPDVQPGPPDRAVAVVVEGPPDPHPEAHEPLAEAAGVRALAVHGRTRADRFKGRAEYDTIREICAAVSIPVFANGDITSPEKAIRVMRRTGAAGLMIGRAVFEAAKKAGKKKACRRRSAGGAIPSRRIRSGTWQLE